MKIFNKYFFAVIIIFAIIFPMFFSYAEEQTAAITDAYMDAFLYDTSEYGSGTGVELTTSGTEVAGWSYNTSKYLQVNPYVPDDEYSYRVVIELPQEFYVLTNEITVPSGYESVSFTKNPSVVANNGTYELNTYSGTITYIMNPKQTSGSIQLEIRYDTTLWDKQKNKSITPDGVKPINVRLEKIIDSNNFENIEEKYISKVTSGTSLSLILSRTLGTSLGTDHTGVYTAKVNETLTQYVYLGTTAGAEYPVTSYFEKMTLTVKYPYYTDGESNKHYLKLDLNSIIVQGGIENYQLIEEDDGIIITIDKNYISTKSTSASMVTFKYQSAESILNNLGLSTIKFSNGSVDVVVDAKNGNNNINLSSVGLFTITIDKNLVENVVLTRSNKSASIIGRPDKVVSQIGGFYLENKGTADSGVKELYIEFDTENTNLMGVTTIALLSDPLQEYIDIEYTLIDENGDRVYLDTNGNRVEKGTTGAIDTWTYSLKNTKYNTTATANLYVTFSRKKLPTTHQQYYFKTLKYNLATIKSGVKLYAQSANSSITGAGNIYAKISDKGVNGDKIISKMTVTSPGTTIANLTTTITTTLASNSSTAYMVQQAKMDKTSIEAGESIKLSARITQITYPYGNSTWLSNIVVGLVLPNGITVNEQSILASYSNNNAITGMIIDSPENIGNGLQLWKITFPGSVYVGLPDEELKGLTATSTGNEYINFSVQLDTSYTMNTTTIFTSDMVFAASHNQTNAASGSYSWASKTDTYDLNENGSTTDKIGGVQATTSVSCQINPTEATLDISDNVAVTHNGIISEEAQELSIVNENDTITYNLDISCSNGGQVDNFEYYIPIPKSQAARDGFLMKSSVDDSFELSIQNNAVISGSDVFKLYYTFDTGLSYDTAKKVTDWYTEEEITNDNTLDWKDVTMIKLVSKEGIIHNGDKSRISIDMKYSGTDYEKEAGKFNSWSSGGYYNYINNGREMAGNFATIGAIITINFELTSLEDIVLTAAKDMTPQGENNVNTFTVSSDNFPTFIKPQTFKVRNIETYNVILQTREYITNNVDMPGVEANQNFAITVNMNSLGEVDLLNDLESQIGLNPSNNPLSFTYKIYNANSLSDNLQNRYIIVTLESDNGVIIKQKIIINREITKAAEFAPSIIAGASYTTINDISTTATITKDSAFTAQFAMSYIPNLYNNQKIVFSESLPLNTTITVINTRQQEKPTYWYYKIDSLDISEIPLTAFYKMGTTGTKYTTPSSADTKEEQFIIIVDFNDCDTYLPESTYNIKLTFEGSAGSFDSTSLYYVIKEKRSFSLKSQTTTVDIGDKVQIEYLLGEISGIESNYLGKKMSLVVTVPSNLPKDSYILVDDTDRYYLNMDREFIIPLSEVSNGSGKINLKLFSNMLPASSSNYTLKFQLWVSSTANASTPKLGEKKYEMEIIFNNNGKLLPSLRVESMLNRLVEIKNIHESNELIFNYIDASNCYATIELHQKVGNGYQKLTNILNQVNGSTIHDRGVFDIDSFTGLNVVDFRISSSAQIGTYRLVLKVMDKDGNELISTPYNFIILE